MSKSEPFTDVDVSDAEGEFWSPGSWSSQLPLILKYQKAFEDDL